MKRFVLPIFLLMASAQPFAQNSCGQSPDEGNAPKVVVCGNGGTENVSCKLPVTTSPALYKSLDDAMVDIGNGQTGFPVDIIAASFGLQDSGWDFSFKPFKFRKSRMGEVLVSLKRYGGKASNQPILISLNPSGLGPHIFDATVVRSLFMTDLFPSSPKFVQEKAGVTYLLLKPELVNDARTAFKEMEQNCPDSKTEHVEKSQKEFPLSGGSESGPHLTSPSANDESPAPEKKLADWLPYLPVRDNVDVILHIDGELCGPWTKLPKKDKDDLSDLIGSEGCLLTLIVELPAGIDGVYEDIVVAGRMGRQGFRCSPDDFGPSEPKPLKCSLQKIKWRMSGDTLTYGKNQTMKIAFPSPPPAAAPQFGDMIVGISGARVGPFAPTLVSCWCTPKECEKPQTMECKDLTTK
jgi:hypothetical protein